MTGPELRAFLIAQGCSPQNDFTLDAVYAHPTREWFVGPFARAIRHNVEQIGLDRYRASCNDCDDFANRARQWAQDCHALTSPESNSALAIGAFFFRPAGGTNGHAIICAVVYTEMGWPVLVFVEPQTGQEIMLTPDEIRSCFGFYF